MQAYFKELFSREPTEILEGDYYYNTDSEGDQFDEADEAHWLNGRFKSSWDYQGQQQSRGADIFKLYDDITCKVAADGNPFMDIACGPGMGLAPMVIAKNPGILCLATDACSRLIKAWRYYINRNLAEHNISLAQFSALDIPIKDNALDCVTSNIGVSSTRNGEDGQVAALKEIYRVLKPGGYFVAVENEWTDHGKIDEVFRAWGKGNYYLRPTMSWHDKFIAAGFEIESEDKHYFRNLTENDCDLGESAAKFSIEIGMKYTLYVARKA